MSVLSAPPPQSQIFPALTRDAVAPLGYQAGDFTYGVPAVWRWGEPATLIIGKFCSLSTEIVIFLGGNHRPDFVTTYPFSSVANWPEAAMIEGHPATKGDVRIGNDVWIGMGAWIMSGVTIGDGAVIGARGGKPRCAALCRGCRKPGPCHAHALFRRYHSPIVAGALVGLGRRARAPLYSALDAIRHLQVPRGLRRRGPDRR